MNFKSPSMIVFYCLIAVTIICFILMPYANAFAIIGSVTLVIACFMATWWSFVRYLVFKRNVEDQKASDAYLYAEKMGDENATKNFSYSKKEERKIRMKKYSYRIAPMCMVIVTIIAIFLFLITTKIIG